MSHTFDNTDNKTSVLPFTLPILLKNNTSATKLPFTLPVTFNNNSSKVRLPFTLPVTFGKSYGTRLPFTLPVTFGIDEGVGKEVKISIPTKEYLVKEGTKTISIPTKEISWIFYGLVFEENVVKKMKHSLTMIEEVRSRILVDVGLINRTTIIVKWYGDKVPKVQVHKKMPIDEKFELVGEYDWEQGFTTVDIGNNEHEILLKGINSTGESSVVTIGESNYVNVNNAINISANEKIYAFDIPFISKHKIKINY